MYDDKLPGIRWRFPLKPARWFGMTVLYGARTSPCRFQFVNLLREADKHEKENQITTQRTKRDMLPALFSAFLRRVAADKPCALYASSFLPCAARYRFTGHERMRYAPSAPRIYEGARRLTTRAQWNDTERRREETTTDQVRHDLAPGPARRKGGLFVWI